MQRRAIVALGHVGGDAARAALRQYVANEENKNPYPAFVGYSRTDRFTFPADSPLNPRTLQEATRALGYLKDGEAVPMLRELLARNIEPRTGNLFLAEAAIEALGRIGTPEAEAALVRTFAHLKDYWDYVGWFSDHPALYACHASPLHARAIEALDRIGSTRTAAIVPHLIRSLPTDPRPRSVPQERRLREFGRPCDPSQRSVRRTDRDLLGASGRSAGESDRRPEASRQHGLRRMGGQTGPGQPRGTGAVARLPRRKVRATDSRGLRVVPGQSPRIPSTVRWATQATAGCRSAIGCCSSSGARWANLGSSASVDTLLASLRPELNESRHGRPDPSQPNIHFLQLEYTPCWRVTAAWALGHIGERRAATTLLHVVGDLNNATDVRHAAAEALLRLADPASLDALKKLAVDYPEVSVRRVIAARL